jgi:hypothetical protein
LASIGNKKVFVAALQSNDLKEEPLQNIGNQGYFLASNISELKSKFQDVQSKIARLSNSLYFLYYRSPISDPSFRENSLEVRIKNNSNGSQSGHISTSFNSQGFN